MISSIEGVVLNRGINSAIIKVGPVSLQVFVPASTLSKIGGPGNKVSLNTHLHVREDVLALYGFASAEDLALFEHLITVSGIGPKVALSLLSTLSTEQIASAIISGNTDILSQVPGIGKKIAGRIILELKGKLEKGWIGEGILSISQTDNDVVAALTALGYSLREATQAVANLSETQGMDLEERVRLALKKLAAM